MIIDFLISIAASLVSSGLTGLLGNKAVSKQNSIILKVYIQFLSVVVFVVTAMLSVILNRDFTSFIAGISEVNMLRFYSNCLNGFIWILLLVAIVTVIIISIEAWDRGSRRDHKQDMDRYGTLR